MEQHILKGAAKMPISHAETEWKKANTVMLSMRLQKTTDADILKFLDGKQKQTIIKQAIREYMDKHKDD